MAVRRGDVAKEIAATKICEIFGSDFVCVKDKKIYVNVDDGGEKVQLAISMTMPKTPISLEDTPALTANTGTAACAFPIDEPTPTEVSPEDRATIEELKKRLGVTD